MPIPSRKLVWIALVALASVAAAQRPPPAAPPASSAIKIPFETYTLPNGLTVILSQDHTTPTVAVNVWYHVGSKNEVPGRTGFAHLFEHIMFTGSGHVPYGLHDKLTEGVGGNNNGGDVERLAPPTTRSCRRTTSSRRCGSSPTGWASCSTRSTSPSSTRSATSSRTSAARAWTTSPTARSARSWPRATYPATNPYSWDVIGSMDDLSAASADDVKNFFRTYYAPNNAFLAIVGDFDPVQAKAWVTKYFGDIPRGKPVIRPTVAPAHAPGRAAALYEDRVQVPRLYIQWPTVGEKNDDPYALDVLGSILAGPRTARLTKALVFDQQAAASVSAYQDSNEDVGEFIVVVTPRPGHTLTELETAVDGDHREAEEPRARRPRRSRRRLPARSWASCAASSRTSARR